jgi:haloalkane dehalogenase
VDDAGAVLANGARFSLIRLRLHSGAPNVSCFPNGVAMDIRTTRSGVRFVRTADDNFVNLPDYSFAPNYIEVDGLRMHYVDKGPRTGPVALLMHGMPTWSFLNRHLIRGLARAGYRCVAADHIGFGKSDKVIDNGWYTIARHIAVHRALIEQLNLSNVTMFCHDWGGPIGLAQAVEMPERFLRLVILNTWLHHDAFSYTPALRQWNAGWKEGGFFRVAIPQRMSIGDLMAMATSMALPADIQALIASGTPLPLTAAQSQICHGYAAPFEGLGEAGLAGPRRFPLSLPFDNPEAGAAADQARYFEMLKSWTRPVLFIWGGRDDVFTEAWGRSWSALFPEASFDLIPDARHFLQETHADDILRMFFARTS